MEMARALVREEAKWEEVSWEAATRVQVSEDTVKRVIVEVVAIGEAATGQERGALKAVAMVTASMAAMMAAKTAGAMVAATEVMREAAVVAVKEVDLAVMRGAPTAVVREVKAVGAAAVTMEGTMVAA